LKKLPKRQESYVLEGTTSYKFFEGEEEGYLIYVDHIKNLTLNSFKAPRIYKENKIKYGLPIALKIDYKSGEMEKKVLLDKKQIKGNDIRKFQLHNVIPIAKDQILYKEYDFVKRFDLNEND